MNQQLAELISTLVIALSSLTGYIANMHMPVFGAALPGATANFQTSLASPITSSATSMTLAANSVRGGGSLSGYQCFTIDEGSAQAETACGTVSGTAVTSITRGISQATGTTTVSALQFSHRRGANVKITDFPLIQILKAQANGEDTYPNILKYASHPTFTVTTDIVDKKYVDDTAFSGAGVIDATTAARGVVELATQIEAASSTTNGSSGVLAIPASSATSTYNSATAALRVVVTQNSGFIDQSFLPSTITKQIAFGTTTFNGIEAASTTVSTFDSSGTWTKPTSGTMVLIEAWGGGGSGGATTASAGNQTGGGGGGGYAWRIMRLSDLGATETVTVGAGGAYVTNADGNVGGSTTFGAHLTAYGGGGGDVNNGGTAAGGGGGGPLGGEETGAGGAGAAGSPGAPLAGAGGGNAVGGYGLYGAGGGGTSGASPGIGKAGGNGYYGGGGGGGTGSGASGGTAAAGGTSTFAGAGGAGHATSNATAGTAPAGGGGGSIGGTSGAGGAGRVKVTVF